MAKTYSQVQQQIAKLQKEADALRAKEIAGVVTRIREAIAHYHLTADDLFGAKPARKAKAAAAGTPAKAPRGRKAGTADGATTAAPATRKKPAPVAIKYRDDAGNTWTGRGNKPRWLAAALAAGKSLDDFRLPA